MADEITVVQSSHGNPMISKSGYLFRLNNLGLEKRMWECARRKYDKCHARIHTTDSINNPVLLSELGTHNHRSDAIACEVKRTLTRIRTDAIASTDSPAHVIARSVQNTTSATQGALPLVRSLKRGIRRMRSTAQGSLVVPHRREDIALPETFQNTTGGEKFLPFDSGANNNDRILIFTTKRNLEFLKLSEMLQMLLSPYSTEPRYPTPVLHRCRFRIERLAPRSAGFYSTPGCRCNV